MYNVFPSIYIQTKIWLLVGCFGGYMKYVQTREGSGFIWCFITFICVCGMCLCSHVYGCTYFQVSLHLYTPACGGLMLATCIFLIILHIFLNWSRVFRWRWSSSIPGICLAILPQQPLLLSPQCCNYRDLPFFPGFIKALGIWTPVFMLEQWILPSMRHFPCVHMVLRIRKGYIICKHFQYHSVYLFNEKTTYVLFMTAEKSLWLVGIAEVIVIVAGSIFPRKEHEDWGLILAKEDRVWRF